MKNNYLNLSIDDARITSKILEIKKNFTPSMRLTVMSVEDFKKNIIEIVNIQNDLLDESDEDLCSDIINDIGINQKEKYSPYMSFLGKDSTLMNNGQTVGEYMKFLLTLGY